MGLISGVLRFLFGVAAGAAIGVAAARLLTPRTTDEYRAAVQERIDAVLTAGAQADESTRAAMSQAYSTAVAQYQADARGK